MTPETILRLCDARHIDKIAITDHNTAAGALALHAVAPERVIVGEEIMTTKGELLGYFMSETVPAGLSPQETIRRLRDQGAAISVSHPYDRLRKGAWVEADLLEIIDQVDAIEVFNSRCLFAQDNAAAVALAAARGLPGTVGSDAHSRAEYGRAVSLLAPFASSVEFVDSLKHADAIRRYSAPWVHVASKAAKWSKKLGLRKRLWEGG